MKPHVSLIALAALGALDVNSLSVGVPYNPGPALPPQSREEDQRRIAAAQAKRDRKAARKEAAK